MSSRVRSTILGLVVAALPSLLWLLATPLSGGPDEPAHVIRAASLARGQLLGEPASVDPGEPGTVVAVPEAVAALPEPACYAGLPEIAADCAGPVGGTALAGELVAMPTTSGRHPPAYYAVVGLPYLADLPPAGNYLPRVVSALACAAFILAAFAVASRTREPRLAVLGVLAALTPMVLQLTGLVNPNGLEAAAAVCLWTSLLILARGKGAPLPRGLLAAAGLSAIAMTLTRPLSSLWLVLALAAAAAVARPEVRRAFLRDRPVRAWAAGALLAALGSIGWLIVVGNPVLEGTRPVQGDVGLRTALGLTLARTPVELQEMIGILGWLDTVLPALVHRVWLAVVAGLCLAALLSRQWRRLSVLAALVAGVVGIPAVFGALSYNELGLGWQGRYTLPLAAGVPILAALTAGAAAPRVRRVLSALAMPAAALLAGVQLLAFAFALRRHVTGVDGPLDFWTAPEWRPPLPATVLLIGFALSQAALLAWLYWRTAGLPEGDESVRVAESHQPSIAGEHRRVQPQPERSDHAITPTQPSLLTLPVDLQLDLVGHLRLQPRVLS